MTDMCKVCGFCTDSLCKVDRFFQIEMRMMWFLSQCIEDEYIKSIEFLDLIFRNGFDVGKVGKGVYAISQDLQTVVLPNHRYDALVTNRKRLTWVYTINIYGRCTRVFMRTVEDVIKSLAEIVNHAWQCVDRYVPLSKEKRANIINTSCVIGMFVCK